MCGPRCAAPTMPATMHEYRRHRSRWVNLIGGLWVFATEVAVVAVTVVVALLVAAVVLWVA